VPPVFSPNPSAFRRPPAAPPPPPPEKHPFPNLAPEPCPVAGGRVNQRRLRPRNRKKPFAGVRPPPPPAPFFPEAKAKSQFRPRPGGAIFVATRIPPEGVTAPNKAVFFSFPPFGFAFLPAEQRPFSASPEIVLCLAHRPQCQRPVPIPRRPWARTVQTFVIAAAAAPWQPPKPIPPFFSRERRRALRSPRAALPGPIVIAHRPRLKAQGNPSLNAPGLDSMPVFFIQYRSSVCKSSHRRKSYPVLFGRNDFESARPPKLFVEEREVQIREGAPGEIVSGCDGPPPFNAAAAQPANEPTGRIP